MNSKQRHTFHTIIGSALLIISSASLRAQTPAHPTKVLTLEETVSFALQNYPQVRESLERVSASRAGVGLAKTNYLPRADMLWQGNRATRNNTCQCKRPRGFLGRFVLWNMNARVFSEEITMRSHEQALRKSRGASRCPSSSENS